MIVAAFRLCLTVDSFAGDESGFVLSVNVSSCIVATKKNVLGMAVGFEKTKRLG